MLTTQRLGRNDTCRCGSGRKFKVCCLQRGRTFDEASPLLQPRRVGSDGGSLRTQLKYQAGFGDEKPIKRIPIHYTYAEPFGEAVCCYCFPVDQPVVLENGNAIHAEWVEAGMKFRMEDGSLGVVTQVEPPKVWAPPSRIPNQYGNYARRVLGTIRHKGYIVIDITLGGTTITGTPDHKWYSVDRAGWVPAETLRRGERLKNSEGTTVVVEHVSEPRTGLIELYNLEVEELHTFFVGTSAQSSALVHNGQGNYILKPASTPVGRRGNPLGAVHPNAPTVIGGRPFSGHAIDQMQARGIFPSAVDNAIRHGTHMPGKIPGTTAVHDKVNRITVILDSVTGRVVTVGHGLIRQ